MRIEALGTQQSYNLNVSIFYFVSQGGCYMFKLYCLQHKSSEIQ
jgi:hypothetical protein